MINLELLKKMDRVHPYPAKYPVELALEYVEKYSYKNDLIYDPFVGSGTTLLAASVLDRKAIGTDINYIAILISKFKTLELSENDFNILEKFIENFEETYSKDVFTVIPKYYNSIEHWFCNDSILVLSLIKYKMKFLSYTQQIFCKTVMSAIINVVSNQESDTRYAAIKKPQLSIDFVANTFIKKYKNTLHTFKEFSKMHKITNHAYLLDSKQCTKFITPNSVDLILTSPPYINTYDYYLYHKHRMNWLNYDVKFSMKAEIGSRREYSSLKRSEDKFSNDLYNIFSECDITLKKGGYIIIVIGDGKVAGKIYDARLNMLKIASQIGWDFVSSSYTYLDDTSKSFQQSYRTKGKKEYILIFRKRH